MSSAAQREETPVSDVPKAVDLPRAVDEGAALRQMAAERLAAHRGRRSVVEGRDLQASRAQAALQAEMHLKASRDAERTGTPSNASRVRDAVATRYRESLSYREYLAAEAQRALEKARAEAEVAARNAKAVAAAQRQLLDEIEQWNQPQEAAGLGVDEAHHQPRAQFSAEPLLAESPISELPMLELVEPPSTQATPHRARSRAREESLRETAREERWSEAVPLPPLQVRLHEDFELPASAGPFYAPGRTAAVTHEELAELDEEIEFRRAPEFRDLVLETTPIQANIIEFPRQLVAPRKARPRLAEGPLREDGVPEPQLRIFEVEAEQISMEPEIAATASAPEWQGLLLSDGLASRQDVAMSPRLEAQLQLDRQLYAAPLQRRMLATAIDALCLGVGFAGSATVIVKITGEALHATPLPVLGAAAAGTLLVFLVLYQLLFLTLNEATPGMRAARLAFCTFSEKKPTRKALRRRLLVSTTLAACPLGLGLLWMALDSDRMGWHDRTSRIYPRAY